MTQIRPEQLGPEVARILNRLDKKTRQEILEATTDLPRRFRNEAIRFYPKSPLRVRTGRLRQSFEEFSRRVGSDAIEMGLRSQVEYAKPLHEGTSRGIAPRKFFEIPIRTVAEKFTREILKDIEF